MDRNDVTTIEAASSIRPFLRGLLGEDDARNLDAQLAALLAEGATGHKVDNLLLRLLTSRDETRAWLAAFTKEGVPPEVSRSYSPLAGRPDAVPPMRLGCPQGDYFWYRRSAGEMPPLCPTHGVALQPVPRPS
jgi:hypothetical protein